MEDFGKIVISIIAAVVYFIYSSSKNVKEQQTRRAGKMPTQDQPAKPVKPPAKVSFEELLKELEAKIQEQLPPPAAEETIEERKNRNKKNIEPVSLEVEVSSDDKYEEPQRFQQSVAKLPMSKQREPLATIPKSVKDTGSRQHPLAAMLSNPDNVRNAFVLSEIFNRKW